MQGLSEDFFLHVRTILSKSLSSNNEERNHHESLYFQLLSENPSSLLIALISVFRDQSSEVRTLSAILLKKLISPSSSAWSSLSGDSLALAKPSLLEVLGLQTEPKIVELLAEAVGLLGVSVLTAQGQKGSWPELLPFVFAAVQAGAGLRRAGLYILKAMFPYMFEELMKAASEIKGLFLLALQDNDYLTRLACLAAMTALITVADTKESMVFAELVPDMLRSVDFILERNAYSGTKAIETMTELVQSEPKLFKTSFALVIELAQHLCTKPSSDAGLKSLCLEFSVSLSERIPVQIQRAPSLGTTLLSLIFEMMVNVDSDVDDSWKVPEEGFCEKDEEEGGSLDIDYTKVGRKLLSRLVDSVGDAYLLQPCLSSIHSALSSSGDWRVVYAGLMALSEVLQYVEDENKLAEAFPIIHAQLANEACKIRYAAFHVLGQLCEDHGPDFQKKHHEVIVPRLVAGLRDPVPRVLAHACAAITNFVEHIGSSLALQYAQVFVPLLMGFLNTRCPSIVVENTCTCLAAIASEVGEGFKGFYFPVLTLLMEKFDTYKDDKYKVLLGRLVECVTLMSKAVGKQVFQPYADRVVSLMRYLQESGSSNEELTGYLLNGWERVCELLGEDFALFADSIVPSILKMLSSSVEMSTSSSPSHFVEMALAVDQKKKFSTTETENKELGLQALYTFVEELGERYLKFVEQTVLVALPLLDFTLNESVRAAAAMLLSVLVGIVHVQNPVKAVLLAKTFIEAIWKAIDDEYTNETLVDELQAIREIISSIKTPFLSLAEVKALGERSLKILENSLENRIKTKEDSDDENDEGFQEYTKKEEDNLHTAISEVFGVLFRTHKELCLEIVEFLCGKVFPRLLGENTRDEDHKFVIFVIDDIIEFLGQDLVAEKWSSFGEVLVRFSADPHDAVRQAAVYGLGVFAANSRSAGFEQWAVLLLQKLEQAIIFPVGKSAKTHGHARDNAIASMGKVISFHSQTINLDVVVPAWLGLLPLRFDKIEARNVTDLIARLAVEQPEVIFGRDLKNLRSVVCLLADALDTKFVKESTVPKIKEALKRLQTSGGPELESVWAGLNESQRGKISKLINEST
jgi:importin-5